MNPTIWLARRLEKNEPWPQSWKMMKVRTEKAAVSTAAGNTSHHEIPASQFMAYQSPTRGMSVLASCQLALRLQDFRKRVTRPCQWLSPGTSWCRESFDITHR